jgi:hypothetical protein
LIKEWEKFIMGSSCMLKLQHFQLAISSKFTFNWAR